MQCNRNCLIDGYLITAIIKYKPVFAFLNHLEDFANLAKVQFF
jgi:hypothetical protein